MQQNREGETSLLLSTQPSGYSTSLASASIGEPSAPPAPPGYFELTAQPSDGHGAPYLIGRDRDAASPSEDVVAPAQRKKWPIVVTIGGIVVLIIGGVVLIVERNHLKDNSHDHDSPQPPAPPPVPPCKNPSLTYTVRNVSYTLQNNSQLASELCLQNHDEDGSWIRRLAFLSNGNPPSQGQWMSGRLMVGAGNITVKNFGDQNIFTFPYGDGSHYIWPHESDCLTANWDYQQPTVIPGSALQLPSNITTWDPDGKTHAVAPYNATCSEILTAPNDSFLLQASSHEPHFLNEVFSLLPDELLEAFKQAAYQGCLYAFLVQLTQDCLTEYLSPKGYSPKQIHYLTQLIKVGVMSLQGGWMVGAVALGAATVSEVMPYLGVPKSACDMIGTAAGLASIAAGWSTKVVTLSGCFVGGIFAKGVVAAGKAVAKRFREEVSESPREIASSKCQI